MPVLLDETQASDTLPLGERVGHTLVLGTTRVVKTRLAELSDKTIPRHMTGREKRVVAIEQYLSQVRVYDPVLDGLPPKSPSTCMPTNSTN